jgi:hypothetical protein
LGEEVVVAEEDHVVVMTVVVEVVLADLHSEVDEVATTVEVFVVVTEKLLCTKQIVPNVVV